MAATKIPTKLYVTAKIQSANSLPLGFLHSHGSKPADAKKRETQESWAYGYNVRDFKLTEEFGDYFVNGTRYTYKVNPTTGRYDSVIENVHELLQHPPRIWDNVPMDGFRILKSITRSTTSNKLWRIEDPRGIEFEITTGSLEDLLPHVTIEKGLILEKCVWQTNKVLVAA